MKENAGKKIVAMLLIIALTFFQILYAGTGIVSAVYEELEQQTQETTNKNVTFDAFMQEDTNKVHSKNANIQAGETINVQIDIKNGGVFNDGKIKIVNDGIKVDKEAIKNDYVKQFNEETGEIELNQVANVSKVEIAIPVKFNKQEKINIDYFSCETEVVLTGNYKDQNEVSTKVEGKIALRILWSDDAEIGINQAVEKYLQLSDKSILLEQSIESQVVDYKLPKEKETIDVTSPKLDDKYPKEVVVIQNGKKLELNKDYSYDETTGKVIIQYVNSVLDGNIVNWENSKDIYKVIYHYSNDVEFNTKTITLNANVKTKMYTKDEIETPANQDIEIKAMGTKNSITKDITSDVYKGYLYANVQNPTQYQEKVTVEVSQVQDKESIILKNSGDLFEASNQEKMSATTYFTSIVFEKEQLDRILGETYTIEITKQDGTNITTIKNDSEVGQDGKFNVNVENEGLITIKISEPVQEGNIDIIANKAIESKTNYTKNQLKTFEKLLAKTVISVENKNVEVQSEMKLNDTKTETMLEINHDSLSTLNTNENIQIKATLKSNSIQDDLYKNPVVKIQLPSEVSNVEFTSAKRLYTDEMEIESIKYYEESKTIEIIFKGEQTEFKNEIDEGIQILINANITLDKMQSSKTSKISMVTTNENRPNEEITQEIPIQIKSKYGAVLYNSVENFNSKGEKLEGLNEETLAGNLDLNTDIKNAKIKGAIINNYEDSIYNACIVVRLPNLEEAVAMQSTIFTKLLNKVVTNREDAKVYYSTNFADVNSQEWVEDIENVEDVKTFKIVIPEIKAGEVVPIEYNVQIPNNLQENQTIYESTNVNYTYKEQNMQLFSNIKLETIKKVENEQNEVQDQEQDSDQSQNQDQQYFTMARPVKAQVKEETQGIQISVNITTPGKEFNIGDDVLEGQNLKYHVTLKNNTGKDLNNFSIEGTQKDKNGDSNVTYWAMKKIYPGNASSPKVITEYIQDKTLNSIKFENDVFSAGETLEYEYEFTIDNKKTEDEVTIGNIIIKADEYEQEKKIMESKIQQGELKLTVKYAFNEEIQLIENQDADFRYYIENMSDHDLENVRAEIYLPHGTVRDKQYRGDGAKYKYIGESEDGIIIEIPSIKQGETIDFFYSIFIGLVDKDKLEQTYSFSMNAKTNDSGTTYYSNEIIKTIPKGIVEISAVQESSLPGDTIKERERVQFTTTIKSESIKDTTIVISDEVPEPFIIEEAYIESDGQKVLVADVTDRKISAQYFLKAGQEIKFIVKLIMDYDFDLVEEVENEVAIETKEYYQRMTTNAISYKIVVREDDEIQEPEDIEEQKNRSSISGTVWVDSNKNGVKDEEEYLNDVEVILIDNSTGKIAKNSEQKEMTTKTNEAGKYFFTNLLSGNYLVAFKYDSNHYELTKYQADGVEESKNSDVISKTISIDGNQVLLAITNEIKVDKNSVNDIDMGLYKKKVFDLSLQKTIETVSAQTSKRMIDTKVGGKNLAKIDIKSKELDNAKVTVEYKFKVTNEGEVDGSVKQIVDYMPKDMNFDSKSNAGWILKDGVLYNETLANDVLKPGETKEITLVLTKTMTKNNTGTVVNTAEIGKDYNDLHIADKDSVAGNKKEKEDDISSAELIISVSTGATTIVFTIIIVIIVLICVGIIIYKKNRKEE